MNGTQGNLHSAGSGIFGTHVTWDDIEHDMQKALSTKANFGSNKTIKNIGDGNGFFSKICLIEPEWQNAEEDEVLPKRFVAKLSTAITIVDFSAKTAKAKGIYNPFTDDILQAFETKVRTFHNNEVHIYNLLDKYNNTVIPRAKVYFATKFTKENPLKGYILMEFVEDLTLIHIYNNVAPETLHVPLRAIASFEALSAITTEEEKAGFSRKPLTEIFTTFFKPDVISSLKKFVVLAGPKMEAILTKLLEVLPELMDTEWIDSIPDQVGMQKVLCHGDLWSTNLLWNTTDSGEHKMMAVIDYQTVHMGNPAGDIVRILNTTLSGKDRVKHSDELIELFFGYLKEEIGDHPMPYTLEQLKEACRRYTPVAGYMIVPLLATKLEYILQEMSAEERKEAMEVLEEKMEAILNDVLEMHKRNKAIIAEKAKQ